MNGMCRTVLTILPVFVLIGNRHRVNCEECTNYINNIHANAYVIKNYLCW